MSSSSTTDAGLLIDPFSIPTTITRLDAGEVLAALEGALVNRQTGMGSPFSAFHQTRVGQSHLLGEQEIRALYRNNWWIRRIIDTPAFDMTRKGVEVKLLDDGDPELVNKVKDKYSDTNPVDSPFESEYSIDEAKAEAVRWARQFGRAYIVVRCNKGEDPSKPLKRVRSFDGVNVLDCYQLQPALEELNSYNPTYYQVTGVRDASNKDRGNDFNWGQRIHKSRVLSYDGNRIHPYDVQVDGTGHDSVIQCLFEIFTRYYQCNEAVAEAMNSFSLFVANINDLSAIISGKDGIQKLARYLQELNTQRSLYRTVVQDGQSSSGDFVERSFAGVAENVKHFADEVTAACDLPHYKIWGSESNTNALSGGGAETRAYAEKIAGWQLRDLHPNDRRLFKMLFAEQGDIPRFQIEYPSIYQPTPEEEEEIRGKQAERYATLSREGIILPLQARLALATEQDIANVLDAEEIETELEKAKGIVEKQLEVEEAELEQSVQAATAAPTEGVEQAEGLEPEPEEGATGQRTVNGQVVPDLDVVVGSLDASDVIRTDKKKGGKKGKKRNCKKGISCGNSCISRLKVCRKKLTGAGKKAAEAVVRANKGLSHESVIRNGESDPVKKKLDQINTKYAGRIEAADRKILEIDKEIEEILKDRSAANFSATFNSLVVKQNKVDIQRRDLIISRDLEIESEMTSLRSRLNRKAPSLKLAVSPSLNDDSSEIPVRKIKSWTNEVNRLTGNKTTTLSRLTLDSDRAYANESGVINVGRPLSSASGKASVFHEFGHHLEFSNPQLKTAGKDWIESRRSGPNKPLSELVPDSGYGRHEIAVPDRFIDPYVGRDYGDRATEVFSMGIEHFSSARGMQQLYLKDPEHFYLTLGAIR
ncbi:DUF1073 domain-containing protein [Leptolyngbyaceae cyanobacterium CCMR0082]|uniref:DUF1073 domain-containing protein n=1 Tax=Adonisia turfae CCMR0082 TaxID=2304604 RepID=A0A6M0SCY5_9CYAN|nr:anti-CBASS Acb1 family protein [Adonisia turfae]NEZ65532.1 DUF1073 domain-containing protein [Adonisia turfae CCMR0082]